MSRYDHAIALLDQAARDAPPSSQRELSEARRCLTMCALLGFDGKERAYILPEPETRTPSSEFRIVEDHETDERRYWTEVTIDGAHVRPCPGWVLLAPRGQAPRGRPPR